MKYTGVVKKMPLYIHTWDGEEIKKLGHGIRGKFRDSEGNEEWRTAKILVP